MKFTFAILILLISQAIWAQNKTVIVAERSTSMGLEQNGIVIEGNLVRFTANSNFLFQKFPYPIGLFETQMTDGLNNFALDLEKPEVIKEKTSQSPHGLKVYINGKPISHESKKVIQVRKMIQAIANDPNLKKKGGVLLRSPSDVSKLKCTKNLGKVCEFKFGYVHK